jgi:phosphoserine phosphatase
MIDLKDFLGNANSENTVLVTDFDGTLYRGLCPAFFRGIANAGLGIVLLFLNFLHIRKFVRLSVNMFKLWRLERSLRRGYKSGEISFSDLDERLIRFFASNILSCCAQKDIEKAVRILCTLCYKGAWQCFSSLKGKCSFVIVSKSFEFLLKKVKERAYKHGVEIEFHGVKMEDNSIAENSVVTREDKFQKVTELLKGALRLQKAVILGDTEDDIAMRDAAIDVLGKDNVFFIAVNPKDEAIIEASDKSFSSWKGLNLYLKSEL